MYLRFSDWNKDFKPGPFPQTEEERRAAAKKYGLLPEDYRTYREDGKFHLHLNKWNEQWLDFIQINI